MIIGKIVLWLIVGALAGSLAGRVVTFRKQGLGWYTNLGVGVVGALVGGYLFELLGIDLGMAEFKISFEDFISAFVGSLLCIVVWWVVAKFLKAKTKPKEGGK